MSEELYKKHRPKAIDDVVGQGSVVKMIKKLLKEKKVPHTCLFTGPSGTGKTTMARILANELGCTGLDLEEVNSADSRGIDAVRLISKKMSLHPLGSECRVWILDEVHQLTKESQIALLKILEDTPSHVYFFLCTSEPSKLDKAILSRGTQFVCNSLTKEHMSELLEKVVEKEKGVVDSEVLSCIIDASEGNARKALVILHQVWGLSKDDQLESITAASVEHQAIQAVRLLFDNQTKWSQVANIIKNLEDDPEKIRRIILGYANTLLLNTPQKARRAYYIITVFSSNFFDSGKAGLAASFYEVFMEKQ